LPRHHFHLHTTKNPRLHLHHVFVPSTLDLAGNTCTNHNSHHNSGTIFVTIVSQQQHTPHTRTPRSCESLWVTHHQISTVNATASIKNVRFRPTPSWAQSEQHCKSATAPVFERLPYTWKTKSDASVPPNAKQQRLCTMKSPCSSGRRWTTTTLPPLHNNSSVHTFALLVENLHRRSHAAGEEEVSRNSLIAPCVILSFHSQSGQSWSNIQIWSKTGQTREVEVQILIFLDVSANLNYEIKIGLWRKLM